MILFITLDNNDLDLIRKGEVVIDTSGRAISRLWELMKLFGSDKFALGTHSPILDYTTG